MAEKVTLQEMKRALWDNPVIEIDDGFATLMDEFLDLYFVFPQYMPLDGEGRILERCIDGVEDTSREVEQALGIDFVTLDKTVSTLVFGRFEERGTQLPQFRVAMTADEIMKSSDLMVVTTHANVEQWHRQADTIKPMTKHYQENVQEHPNHVEVASSLIVFGLDEYPQLQQCRGDVASVYAIEEKQHEATLYDYLHNMEAVKAEFKKLAPKARALTHADAQWDLQFNTHCADLTVAHNGWKFYIEFPYNGIYIGVLLAVVTEAWLREGWKRHAQRTFGNFTTGWVSVNPKVPQLRLRWFAERLDTKR